MNKKTYVSLIKLVLIIALVGACLMNLKEVLGVIGKFLGIISPFIAGCIIAMAMNVLMKVVERKWSSYVKLQGWEEVAGLNRPIAILVSLIVVFGIIALVIFLIGPGLYRSLADFARNIPSYMTQINRWWDGIVAFAAQHGVALPEMEIDTGAIVEKIGGYLNLTGDSLLSTTIAKTTEIFGFVFNALLSMIFALYMLAQKEKICSGAKKVTYALLPENKADIAVRVANIANDSFSNFISGQCIEACLFGTLVFIGMAIFRFPFAGMIAVLQGFTALIPVFGAFIGCGIGAFLILLVSPVKALWFILFIIVIQQLDNNLIYPRIVGKSVGLPGLLVLLAVTVGGSGFGILGMLLSVPLCAMLYEIFKEFIDYQVKKKDTQARELTERMEASHGNKE